MSVRENLPPYAVHHPHTASSPGPIRHHYLLNFAVSIATILFGIAIIAAFALAIRWRKRTTQQYLLEPRGDVRIPQGSVSDVSDGRSTISIKFPPPGLSPPRDRPHFLPRTPPDAHHPPQHARALRTCQSCTTGPSNRPPCYCPTCPNGPGWDNPPAYRANPSPPFPPDVIASPRLTAAFGNTNNTSLPRRSITDENAIRRNSQPPPPAQAVSPDGCVRSVQDSPTPAGHARGNVVAPGDIPTSCSSASTPPTLSPSSVSSPGGSPRLGPSVVDPPPLQLSDDTGTATLNYGRELDIIVNRGPLGLAQASPASDAHTRVTSPSHDRLDGPSYGTRSGERTTVTSPPTEPHLCPPEPSSSTAVVEGRSPLSGGGHHYDGFQTSRASTPGMESDRRFTDIDVDTLPERDPLAGCSEDTLGAGGPSGNAH